MLITSCDGAAVPPAVDATPYAAPAIRSLGSLADLTLGGTDLADSDGYGGAGDNGSFS